MILTTIIRKPAWAQNMWPGMWPGIAKNIPILMSEFAPICISFLISLLVSWVLLGLIFASNSSTHALFRKRGIPFLFVATLVLFCYLVVLLVGFDFHLLFSKMESLILRKGLSFFLQRVGWEVGLFLAIILALFDVESPAISNMMTPSGASGASSSGNWRQYLNFSSGNEGDSAPETSTAPAPADRPPEQSTSSTWSGSWIGRWFNPEVAPNNGGHETTRQPIGVMEQAGPSQGPFDVPETDPDVLWRELEQLEGAPPLPYDEPDPVEPPLTIGYRNALNANERQAWEDLRDSAEYKYMDHNLTKCSNAIDAISERIQKILDQNNIQIEYPKDIKVAVELYFWETMKLDPVERFNALIRAYQALPNSNLWQEILKEIKKL
jgi:hypothetical protein